MRHCFILPFFVLATPALAQEGVEKEIVVTGRGLGQALGESVYDVVVIDRDGLTGSASNRLDEILKDVPGFQLYRRSDARSANPTSQGATLRALGGNASSRALLILDGVPQTDPFGGWINWPAFDPQRLGQARVVRGGGSGANGPGALAGTIELSSAAADQLQRIRAFLAAGSRESVDASGAIGAAIGPAFLMLSASHGRGAGFIPVVEEQRGAADRPSPYRHSTVSLRALVPVGEGTELQVSGLLFGDDRERGTAFTAIRTRGADGSVRLVGQRWSALAYVQERDYYNSFASVDSARSRAVRVSEQYDVPSIGRGARAEVRPALGPVEMRLGADWRRTEGETRELFNFQNGTGTRRRIAGGSADTFGGFAEAAIAKGALTLTGGGRIDRWLIRDGFLDETLVADGATLNAFRHRDRSGVEPTTRAGASWRAPGGLTVRSAAYLGWRLPTLNELYRPFRAGADATAANPELAPERLRGVEAGLDYRPSPPVRLGVTVFANALRNAIANVTIGRGPGLFPEVGFVGVGGEVRKRHNLDSIDAAGVELDLALDLGDWSLSGGYSFVDAQVRGEGAAAPLDGLRPAQTPRHMLSARAGWTGPGGQTASVGARYVGGQFEDDSNLQTLPGAVTVDAAAALPLTEALSLELRAENIGNARVVAAIGSNGLVERATPRTLWLGVRLQD